MYNLISIGDATIDVFHKIHEASVKCTLNKESCLLCVNYADKIPVDEIHFLVAGNAANNAVGASRLGMEAAIYVNVGGDQTGRQIEETLKKEKVSLEYLKVNKQMQSNYSTVLSFEGERTIFVYHQPWKYELPELSPASWIYLTSLSKSFIKSNLYAEIYEYLKKNRSKLVYNPGTFQLNYGVKHYLEILKMTYVFIVNKEEAKKVLNYSEKEEVDIKKLLRGLKELGPEIVVITNGQKGSHALYQDKYYFCEIFPGERIEATGAGDSFATALISALFYNKDIKEALAWGSINAASVVGKIGPQEGLLRKKEIEERIGSFTAKEI